MDYDTWKTMGPEDYHDYIYGKPTRRFCGTNLKYDYCDYESEEEMLCPDCWEDANYEG